MKLFSIKKNPVVKASKEAKVKKSLLHTYLTSLLSLVLCVAMFLGTSFAWFTSEVENKGNEIYIGTLDVELEKQVDNTDGTTSFVSLSETNADGVNTNKLFDGSIRWEPGYTALETIKITNKGDLAFRYELNFTGGKLDDVESENLSDVAKYFEVRVYKHSADNTTPDFSKLDYTSLGDGWTDAVTLDKLLSGKAVLHGNMTAADVANEKDTSHTYTIALHMKENADGADLMGHKISLNVKLVAYQMGSENDAFGNKYDQMVATAAELNAAFQNGGTVALAADIDMDNTQVTIPAGVSVILDLNGHKITDTVDTAVSMITNNGNLTINGDGTIAITFNGTVDGNKAVNAIQNNGTLTINGGTISNTGKDNQIGYAIDNYNGAVLTVNAGEITASGSSYYDGIRLFCGSNETVVTVNGGEISSIWAQNPSTNKATEVKGTVILNGGNVTTTYYENYTTVKVADGVAATVTPYGAGSDNTTSKTVDSYTVYSFVH